MRRIKRLSSTMLMMMLVTAEELVLTEADVVALSATNGCGN